MRNFITKFLLISFIIFLASPTFLKAEEVSATINLAAKPFRIAINKQINKIYIAHYTEGTLSIIDGSTDQLLNTISVGQRIIDFDINEVTNKIYLLDNLEHKVIVVDGSTDQIITSINVTGLPYYVEVLPSLNKIYATGYSSSIVVSVIDGSTDTLLKEVGGNNGYARIRINQNTKKAYIFNNSDKSAAVLDCINDKILTTINGAGTIGAINESLNKIYVIDSQTDILNIIDGATDQIINTVNIVDPFDLVILQSLNKVYIASYYQNKVYVLDENGNLLTTVDIPTASTLAVNNLNNKIYVANYSEGKISIIDGNTDQILQTLEVGSAPKQIKYNSETDKVYVINYNDSSVSVITNPSVLPEVKNFSVANPEIGNRLDLSWENPTDPNFQGVRIVRKTTGFPADENDGDIIYEGTEESYQDEGLTDGIEYFYKIFVTDGTNFSNGVEGSGIPTDKTAPQPPTNFWAQGGKNQITLSWENPSDSDFQGVMLRFKTDSYPTDPTDGELIYQGTEESFTHQGLGAGENYYYTIFSYDEANNFSEGVNLSYYLQSQFKIYALKGQGPTIIKTTTNRIFVGNIFSNSLSILDKEGNLIKAINFGLRNYPRKIIVDKYRDSAYVLLANDTIRKVYKNGKLAKGYIAQVKDFDIDFNEGKIYILRFNWPGRTAGPQRWLYIYTTNLRYITRVNIGKNCPFFVPPDPGIRVSQKFKKVYIWGDTNKIAIYSNGKFSSIELPGRATALEVDKFTGDIWVAFWQGQNPEKGVLLIDKNNQIKNLIPLTSNFKFNEIKTNFQRAYLKTFNSSYLGFWIANTQSTEVSNKVLDCSKFSTYNRKLFVLSKEINPSLSIFDLNGNLIDKIDLSEGIYGTSSTRSIYFNQPSALEIDEGKVYFAFIYELDPNTSQKIYATHIGVYESNLFVKSKSEFIPTSGGEINSPEMNLVIPDGAVSEPVTISINKLGNDSPEYKELEKEFPQLTQIIGVFDFKPDGLEFNKPIEAEIFVDPYLLDLSSIPSDWIIAFFEETEEKTGWEQAEILEIDKENNSIKVKIAHFSAKAIGVIIPNQYLEEKETLEETFKELPKEQLEKDLEQQTASLITNSTLAQNQPQETKEIQKEEILKEKPSSVKQISYQENKLFPKTTAATFQKEIKKTSNKTLFKWPYLIGLILFITIIWAGFRFLKRK